MSRNRKFFLTLASLIGASVFARCFMCWMPFEYDEIFTAVTANPTVPLGWIVHSYLLPDVHPPFYNVFLWFYNHLVAYGPEWLMRLPSVLCGIFSLWISWKFFPKRLGKMARWVFTTLVAINYFLLFFSQQARSYSFLFLEALLFTFLFFDLMRRLDKKQNIGKKRFLLYALLLSLLAWTHYFGAVLAGVGALVLFVRSLCCKRYIPFFVGIPLLVFMLFSAWIIPNWQMNVALERFDGAWWANMIDGEQIWKGITAVFFYQEYIYIGFITLWLVGICKGYRFYRRHHVYPYGRELLRSGLLAGLVYLIAIIFFYGLHMSFFLGRYFMVLIPAIYILYTLSVLPLLQSSKISRLCFGILCCISFSYNVVSCWFSQYEPGMVSKLFAQFYKERGANKDLYVISNTPYPELSLEPIYSFYPNERMGMRAKVYELNHLDEGTRDELLALRKQAIIFMHNCRPDQLNVISKQWNRAIGVEGKLRGSCLIQVSEKGASIDPSWEVAVFSQAPGK